MVSLATITPESEIATCLVINQSVRLHSSSQPSAVKRLDSAGVRAASPPKATRQVAAERSCKGERRGDPGLTGARGRCRGSRRRSARAPGSWAGRSPWRAAPGLRPLPPSRSARGSKNPSPPASSGRHSRRGPGGGGGSENAAAVEERRRRGIGEAGSRGGGGREEGRLGIPSQSTVLGA